MEKMDGHGVTPLEASSQLPISVRRPMKSQFFVLLTLHGMSGIFQERAEEPAGSPVTLTQASDDEKGESYPEFVWFPRQQFSSMKCSNIDVYSISISISIYYFSTHRLQIVYQWDGACGRLEKIRKTGVFLKSFKKLQKNTKPTDQCYE